MKCTAIVLAAGRGKRMQSDIQKQYMELKGYPVLYYSLQCFQECPWMDEIILVTGPEDIEYCQKEIVEKYNFDKVSAVVAGGRERYNSVYHGLQLCWDTDYVFIHDGARPMVDQGILERGLECVKKWDACAAGMPSKDTVKIVNKDQRVISTPDRSGVWNVQTPQVFSYVLVMRAYEKAIPSGNTGITDDAMVVEQYGEHPVTLYEGSYKNIKITTPEDMDVARIFLKKR